MIGDVLASSLICNSLKSEFPNAQIDYLVSPFTKPVLENNPNIDNVVFFEDTFRKDFKAFYFFLKRIRYEKYDIVIDPFAKLESGLVTFFSGAKQKIGYLNKGVFFAYNKKVTHHDVPYSNYGLAIERKISLIKDIVAEENINPYPKLFLTEKEKDQANTLFKRNDLNHRNIIMFNIFGSTANKTYPEKYMVEIINYITENNNVKILFNYTPKQYNEALSLYSKCSTTAKEKIILDVIGTDLRSFITIMNHCNFIIGNDGGAINIAKALNKPTFTIFSPWIKKESWSTFEDGLTHIGVHLNDYEPNLLENKSREILKSNYLEYYIKFEPKYFKDLVNQFIKNQIHS